MSTQATNGRLFYRVARFLLRQLSFAYFQLRVEGLSRIPARGPAILAGNHPNVLDGILLLVVSPRPRPITIAFAPLVSYGWTVADPVPAELLQQVLDDVRSEILRPMQWAMAALGSRVPRWPLKPAQVALSACAVLPLAGFLVPFPKRLSHISIPALIIARHGVAEVIAGAKVTQPFLERH